MPEAITAARTSVASKLTAFVPGIVPVSIPESRVQQSQVELRQLYPKYLACLKDKVARTIDAKATYDTCTLSL